jgi:acyl dehydratase
MIMTRTLSKSPRTLPLYARAAAAALPGARRLAFLPGGAGEIPDVRLTLGGVRADPHRLAAYWSLCGFGCGEHLPATYPHILAFPLHMTLLTDGRFPFAPVGLVHIENRILQHRPIPRSERLDLHVRAGAAEAHPRGRSFALITEARIAGESVWESTSTMLHRSRHTHGKQGGGPPARERDTPEAAITAGVWEQETWTLAGELGRRYAAVSGDRNPIHMHPLPARALGFPGAIAHGMWTLARAIAALADERSDAHGIEAAFNKPIVLPATVQLTSRAGDGETEFAVRDAAQHTPHLRGRLWPLEAEGERTTTGKQTA